MLAWGHKKLFEKSSSQHPGGQSISRTAKLWIRHSRVIVSQQQKPSEYSPKVSRNKSWDPQHEDLRLAHSTEQGSRANRANQALNATHGRITIKASFVASKSRRLMVQSARARAQGNHVSRVPFSWTAALFFVLWAGDPGPGGSPGAMISRKNYFESNRSKSFDFHMYLYSRSVRTWEPYQKPLIYPKFIESEGWWNHQSFSKWDTLDLYTVRYFVQY